MYSIYGMEHFVSRDRAAEGRRWLDQEGLHRFLSSDADRSRSMSTSATSSASAATAGSAFRGGGGGGPDAPPTRLMQRPLLDYFVRSPLIPRSVAGIPFLISIPFEYIFFTASCCHILQNTHPNLMNLMYLYGYIRNKNH